MQETGIFDGHNDVLLRLWSGGPEHAVSRFRDTREGHISLSSARDGNLFGGFFAVFVPSSGSFKMPDFQPPYDIALPDEVAYDDAFPTAMGQISVLHKLEEAGCVRICINRDDIEAARKENVMAAILHIEGAEAIDDDLNALETFFDLGLRSIGPVWSRPNRFGHGVPFRYPADPDIGPGLTEAGRELVRECTNKRIMIDTSHLNLAGFHDVANEGARLVATHSNAHAVSPGARNLTDEQLDMIGETGGMAGLNFGTMFLREDGRKLSEGCIDAAMRHLDRMIEKAGEDHVGLGSDFDGAPMPKELAHAGMLGNLVSAMKKHGFGDELVDKLSSRNWMDLIGRVIG